LEQPVNISATHNVQWYLSKTWNVLTGPAPTLEVPEQRRQAQFLATVLVLIIPVIFITSCLKDLGIAGGAASQPGLFLVTLLAMPFSLAAYLLSRTCHYRVAAVMAVATASAAVFAAMFPSNIFNQEAMSYLVVPLLLSSILLSMRSTFLVTILQILVLVLLAFVRSDVDLMNVLLPALRFQFLCGVLILFGAHFRNLLANDRNLALRQSEEWLRKANEELEKRVAERTAAHRKSAVELMQLIGEREATERKLQDAYADLEQRVAERTAELSEANARLRDQIAERQRVEAAEREQRLLAEALRDTSAAINSTLNLPEILEQILVYVARVLSYDSATVMLLETGVARVVHGRGFEGRGIPVEQVLALRFDIDQSSHFYEMCQSGRATVIPDTLGHPAWRQLPETNWIRSYVGAPIFIGGQVIGFLNLDSASPNAFTQAHADRLKAFADQAGLAIHNANLFEAISRYANEQEHRVAERTAELVNERAQLRAIMDSMNEGVFGVVFGEKPTKYANVSFQKLTGYSSDDWSFDLLKLTSTDLPSEFVNGIDTIYEQLTQSGFWQGEGPVQRKDGSCFDAHVFVTRIDNMDGRAIGTVTIVRDVSHEKALEQQKSFFVANASHELRTPITNLMTRLYLLKRQPEALDTHLGVLDEIARRMRTLVEDLLDHSRFERGVIPLEPKVIDLCELIEQVVNLQMPEAEKKHIELQSVLPETKLTAMVDPERMIQVLTNLIINAIHYTPEGGLVKVSAGTVQQGGSSEVVVINVQDSGIGIPGALLPNVFKPFFRVSEKTKGTGLGLSIAHDIVMAHGGDITVDSQPGIGSRFTVALPGISPASV
jgi:PAS domain S-box-containing protein